VRKEDRSDRRSVEAEMGLKNKPLIKYIEGREMKKEERKEDGEWRSELGAE